MLRSRQKPLKGLTFLLQVHSALFRGQNNPKKVSRGSGGNCTHVHPLKTCDFSCSKWNWLMAMFLIRDVKYWHVLENCSHPFLLHGHFPSLTVVCHVNMSPSISITTQSPHKEANNDPCTHPHKISIKFTTLDRGRKLENDEVNPRLQTPHRDALSQK